MTLKEVKIEKVNRELVTLDMSKAIGDMLWSNATNIQQNRLSQDIYDGVDIDLSAEDKKWIKDSLNGKLIYAYYEGVMKIVES